MCEKGTTTTVPALNISREEIDISLVFPSAFHEMAPDVFDVIPDSARVNCGNLTVKDDGIGKRDVRIDGKTVDNCYRIVMDIEATDITRIRLYVYPDYSKQEKKDD